ncbi:nephrin-like [Macrosteles quadrilineatus]|uniref:nephrin-like n=1 Tax=Macrosteles quadrilineatus TaxID=74068 RepID=UPI0023E30227|nr:nephrin-like [Macrosteles quadrilineatus]
MAKDSVLLLLTPLLVVICTQLGLSNVVVDEIVDVVSAEAVAGFTALLPCDLSPPVHDDKVHLVIWYKDSIDLPIYSYDARGTAPEKGTHWAADSSLGERAYFRYKDEPSRLELRHIREGDAGLYRCRVDFRKSPTRNSKVNLTIILPPQKLSVLDERGSHIQHYILGPYTEGASMEITCLSTGGRPLPKVTWWQENALLDDSYETLSERRVRNVLRLERLERRHLHTVFTCQAANNNLVAPISSAVTLDLYLDPMWVRLLGQNRPMSADQTYEVSCEVVGARPAPIITWWKGNQPMRNARESVVGLDGNVTVSTLKLTPTLDDAGEELTCRATTPPAERNVLQDSWTLNIYHVPIVYLELIGKPNATVVKEGVDIIMECRINSNPWIYRISWRHNGRTLFHNASAGTVITNQTLSLLNITRARSGIYYCYRLVHGRTLFHNASAGTVITNQTLSLLNITRARSGIYTCMGSNQEGDGESNAIVLDVKFVPVCRPGQLRVLGAARQEVTRVTCEVEANPATVHFTWRFNNSAETVDIPESQYTLDKTRSTVAYTPIHDWDFGNLLCWAHNELGTQLEPCVYSVVPQAGRPDPLGNCTIANQTAEMLEVECDPGYDGGLPQLFVMEIYDGLDQTLVNNVSSRSPAFLVTGLPSGLELDLVLYSVNNKGRSRPHLLHAYTLRSAARRSVISPGMMHVTPMLGVLAGAVLTLLCIIIAISVVIRLRRVALVDKKTLQTNSRTSHSSDSVDSLDKNPDIIPQKEDFTESEESMFQKSKLSFYFSPDSENSSPIKPAFPRTVELSEFPPPRQPRRVTFQCQAATLPRRMGAAPTPPPSAPAAADDSMLGVPATVIRLRPETSRLSTHL